MRRSSKAASVALALGVLAWQGPVSSYGALPTYAVTASTPPGAVKGGGTVSVSGLVTPKLGGIHVYLQDLLAGKWHTMSMTSSVGGGAYTVQASVPVKPQVLKLRAFVLGNVRRTSGHSGLLTVPVVARAFAVHAASVEPYAETDTPFPINGALTPAVKTIVDLQTWTGRSWLRVVSTYTSSSGSFRFAVQENAPGLHRYQVVARPTSVIASATSNMVGQTVAVWHYLSDLSTVEGGVDTGVININGDAYAHSIFEDFYPEIGDSSGAAYILSRKCYRFQTIEGLDDTSSPTAQIEFQWLTDGKAVSDVTKGIGAGTDLFIDVTSVLRFSFVVTETAGGGDGVETYPAFGNAEVLCSF